MIRFSVCFNDHVDQLSTFCNFVCVSFAPPPTFADPNARSNERLKTDNIPTCPVIFGIHKTQKLDHSNRQQRLGGIVFV